jgi:hypothetical protein
MGIEALTRRDDGSEVLVPVTGEQWDAWISAGRTRNWMMGDPLIDWLQRYGKSRGYRPGHGMGGYREELDFMAFIFGQGREFEAGILRLLSERYPTTIIAHEYRDIRRLEKAGETYEEMCRGTEVIHQGVLRDAENLTYGAPDFLIRSDILHELFPDDIAGAAAALGAPDLGANGWHYRVVDTKFTTLHLNAAGNELLNGGSAAAYKAQLYIYNRMLGRLQGYRPPESYVLGRGWERTQRGEHLRGNSALQRLGPVPQDAQVAGAALGEMVADALDWVRRMRTEGHEWQLLPEPSVPELYPNMGSADDGDMMVDRNHPEPDGDDEESVGPEDWGSVKKWLADELKEMTLLWRVGMAGRARAHKTGVRRWDDTRVNVDGVITRGAATYGPTLSRMLEVNTGDGPTVLPRRVVETKDAWYEEPGVEFYVDFEYCGDLNDDFSQLPEKGGQSLIFMIGCGHLEDGEWRFVSFVTDELSEEDELRIIGEWVEHMESVRDLLDPGNHQPRVVHWSGAEVNVLERQHNSARNRHGERANWSELGWYDFLREVMHKEPVVVRGALGFGLKAVAKAMHSHGLIETDWEDNQVDGLGAMVGAWRCDAEAHKKGVPMGDLELMRQIARYNEVDCKVMMEIVRYLRGHH